MTKTKIIFASVLGNALELYDFSLYGIFIPLLTPLFFPTHDPLSSLLLGLGTFAIGFLVRPLGGILFGYLGDRWGRKHALALSIILMAIPTFMMGILPTYHQIGIMAPILLVTCRLFQGLCAGGEYSGASIFIIEHLGEKEEGFAGSLISSAGALGSLIAMSFGALCLNPSFPSWSWRVPFIIGAFLALFGFYIRRHLQETPDFENAFSARKSAQGLPLTIAFSKYPLALLKAFIIGALANMLANTLVVYFNVYLTKVVGVSLSTSMFLNSIGLFLVIPLIPLMGWISDKISQRVMMSLGLLTLFVSLVPLFYLLKTGGQREIIVVQLIFSLLIGCILGPSNAFMNKLFPPDIRYSGVAFSYCLGMAIFGGTMPLISTFLIELTQNALAPAYYLMTFVMAALIVVRHKPSSIQKRSAEM